MISDNMSYDSIFAQVTLIGSNLNTTLDHIDEINNWFPLFLQIKGNFSLVSSCTDDFDQIECTSDWEFLLQCVRFNFCSLSLISKFFYGALYQFRYFSD